VKSKSIKLSIKSRSRGVAFCTHRKLWLDKAKEQYDEVTTTITDYLRNTGKEELNPEGIQRDLARLFENPQAGATALRRRLSQIDRDTLVKLLSQRQDLSEEQVNQVINQVQTSIRDVVRAPRRVAARTQARVQNFQAVLEDYLRNTGKEELNPEGIKRDLQTLLNDPRAGVESLSDRLSHFDRSTVVQLLQAREICPRRKQAGLWIKSSLSANNSLNKYGQFSAASKTCLMGFLAESATISTLLDRPELNYDGIKRDVRQMFNDPQLDLMPYAIAWVRLIGILWWR
jgi:hypothetical protein